MTFENVKTAIVANSADFAAGAFDAAVQTPWNQLDEWSGNRLGQMRAVSPANETVAGKLGQTAGALFDMGVVTAAGAAVLRPLLGVGRSLAGTMAVPEVSASIAADRVSRWYPKLEPRLGVNLTDPNVVLTLGNARGHTEFFVHNPQVGDVAAIQSLNKVSMPEGIKFTARESTVARTTEPMIMVGVENLAGFEVTSRATKLPGVTPFSANSGWDGLKQWYRESRLGLEAAQSKGLYNPEIDATHIAQGITRGYPDEAVIAAVNYKYRGLSHTAIPYADYYRSAQPNYLYHPADSGVVKAHTERWSNLLQGYYESATHKRLAADPEFIRSRAVTENWRPPPRKASE